MSKFTQETRKKFSTIPFYCDNCNNHVMINRYDVLIAGLKNKLCLILLSLSIGLLKFTRS